MVVCIHNFVSFCVSFGDVTLNNSILKLVAIELVGKTKPMDVFITQLGFKACVINCFFTKSGRSSCSESAYWKVKSFY